MAFQCAFWIFFCDPITTIVMIMIRLTKDLFFSFDLFGSIDWPQSPFHLQTNFGDFYFRVFVWWSFFVRLFVSLKKKCWQSVRLGLWFQCLQRSRSSSKKIGKRKQLTTCGVGYIFWLLSVCLCELLLQCLICPTKRRENYKKGDQYISYNGLSLLESLNNWLRLVCSLTNNILFNLVSIKRSTTLNQLGIIQTFVLISNSVL